MWHLPNPPFFSYEKKVMGIYLVSDTVLEGKEELECNVNPGVMFEKILLPYDSETNTLYIPQNLEKGEWVGTLSIDMKDSDDNAFYLCSPIDEMWKDKSKAVRGNYNYCLWLVSEKFYYKIRLVVTGTPIISIRTKRQENVEKPTYEEDPDAYVFDPDVVFYGNITVFDPSLSGDSYLITETGVSYYERGASAKGFSKKSYNIDLLDIQENSLKASLLGMREDNSWKLNALFLDQNRVRDITASMIWEEFDIANENVLEPGPRMKYVELILDDQYCGLYCLMEPVDRKKLQLGAGDVLYKIINWNIPEDSAIQESADRGWNVQYPIRMRYPKEVFNYDEAWRPIREYLRLFYWSEETDYETGLELVNLENLMDYSMFLMAVSACDNTYKNDYLAAYRDNEGYSMLTIPWDLDLTFGNVWWMDTDNHSDFSSDVTPVYIQQALLRLYEAAPDEIGPLVWEKWSEYRNGFLSTEAVCGLLIQNRDYLVETGAAERESVRWPESNVSMDIDAVLRFQRERMEWLDEYFHNWGNKKLLTTSEASMYWP